MGYDGPPSTSHDERAKRHLQIVYTRETHERQIFMQELKTLRRKREKQLFKSIKDDVGPRWYQALSVPQRVALDNLVAAIYQDLLEGRANRTSNIIKSLGLCPRPNNSDLLVCCYYGRDDPKQMLAHLYYITYGYSIDVKRLSYNLNAKLILSAILYLGLNNLIFLLKEKFRPDNTVKELIPRVKSKPGPPLESPYLEKMIAFLWEKPVRRRAPPPPLPNLDDLDDPYEEVPTVKKPAPPPPPPPPPKNKIPREVCDALAGIYKFERPKESQLMIRKPIKPGARRGRLSKPIITESKKVYGIGISFGKGKSARRKKPVAPSTGLPNAQYTINGIFTVNNRTVYVLGSVSILPANGELIHGGYANVGNQPINIHCGYRGRPPAARPDPCDCVKTWQDPVFKYLKDTKCYCGHYYDFGNEETFPSDELPFFIKPTRHAPMEFKYDTIYDTDEKQLLVKRDFKKLWDTDSVLNIDRDAPVAEDKKKKKKKSSGTCLGSKPKPEDYLRCALRFMSKLNIAARLPDLHLVPELKEWMRNRIHGPLKESEKTALLKRSTCLWGYFRTLADRGFGHVAPPKDAQFVGHTNWLYKQKLNDKFQRYTYNYRLKVYRSHAYFTNLLWRTMCQAEFPDKKFREIFFSYLFATLKDLQLVQPYNSKEVAERKNTISQKRYICLPAGIESLRA